MKAALKTADGRFEVTDVERPIIPADDFVLARVKVAGICGTDLRHWNKAEPELECHIVGHELAGEVVEVGENVVNLRPGDRVVIETVMGDGVCVFCNVQQYNICEHLYDVRTKFVSRAYGEFVAGPEKKFYKLPDHVSFEEAALIDTFSVCLHAHHLGQVSVNQKIVVIGAGPIGLGQLQLAKLSGADVLVADVVDSSLDLASELGANVVVNNQSDDLIARVEDGIYIVGDKSWSIDMQRYNFQFTGQRFFRIRDGRLDGQLRDVAYQATTTDFWGAMEAVGGPSTWRLGGAFNCGKAQPGQVAAVSHGCPSALFRGINVLNTVTEAGR